MATIRIEDEGAYFRALSKYWREVNHSEVILVSFYWLEVDVFQNIRFASRVDFFYFLICFTDLVLN